MKLDAIDGLGFVNDGCKFCATGRRDGEEVFGQLLQLVAMGHPQCCFVLVFLEVLKKGALLVCVAIRIGEPQRGFTILPFRAPFHVGLVLMPCDLVKSATSVGWSLIQ